MKIRDRFTVRFHLDKECGDCEFVGYPFESFYEAIGFYLLSEIVEREDPQIESVDIVTSSYNDNEKLRAVMKILAPFLKRKNRKAIKNLAYLYLTRSYDTILYDKDYDLLVELSNAIMSLQED